MVKAILNGLMSAITALINVICLPIDLLISNAFPDLTSSINTGISSINQMFSYISYALGFLPSSLIQCLIIILTLQVTFLGLVTSYHGISRLYKVILKIKFW